MEEITFAFQPNRQYSTSKVKYGDIMTAITEFSKGRNVYNVFRVSGKNIFAPSGMCPSDRNWIGWHL